MPDSFPAVDGCSSAMHEAGLAPYLAALKPWDIHMYVGFQRGWCGDAQADQIVWPHTDAFSFRVCDKEGNALRRSRKIVVMSITKRFANNRPGRVEKLG